MMFGLFALMLVFFAFGTPIAFSMALASAAYMHFVIGVPLEGLPQRMVGGIDTFPLLAIPFFILAGNLMNTGGITDRLVMFAKVLVGHITGGLAHVNIVTSMIMAGMSGSAVTDAASTSMVLVPAMRKAGFPAGFSSAVTAASATVGPIIPPSIPIVIYASIASVSTGRLLLAGAVPGLVMGLMLLLFSYVISKRRRYPAESRAACGQVLSATLHAIPPMGMPVIILGGIVGGVMTPTEAAAAGAAYALILGMIFYREIKPSHLPGIVTDSAIATAAIVIIMAAAQPFGWVLTFEQAPVKVLALFADANLASWQLLLILNVIMLCLGMVMEGLVVMVMAVPIVMPLLAHAGIDPVHFGVILVINVMIGAITPPVGTIMYVTCMVSKTPVTEFAKEVWPLVIALIIAMFMMTLIPDIVLWLPNTLMPAS
jgi:tripartite ATP-independent transporter DctM subunit